MNCYCILRAGRCPCSKIGAGHRDPPKHESAGIARHCFIVFAWCSWHSWSTAAKSAIGWPLPASAAIQKFRRLSRWSIVSSICSSWIAKICAKSRLPPGANRWPTFLRKAPENLRLSDELRGSKDKLLRVAKEFAVRSLRRGRRCRRWWVVQTCVALISPHRSGSRRRSISGGARRRGCKGSPRW